MAVGFQVISSQEDTLFLDKMEVDQTPTITKQEWRKQQSQDKTIAEIKRFIRE